MCLLALDCCLVDLRSCRMIVPLASSKGAVHICQALMRMQHCNIAGGNCSVLASHNSICNMAHVQLHSIDSVGLAAGLLYLYLLTFAAVTFSLQSLVASSTHMQSSLTVSDLLPLLPSA